nr:hypothetical protein CFP56_11202 [Quercus suber]
MRARRQRPLFWKYSCFEGGGGLSVEKVCRQLAAVGQDDEADEDGMGCQCRVLLGQLVPSRHRGERG